VDEGAALALEVGQGGHRPVGLPVQVDVHHPPELLGRSVLDRSEQGDRGAVHPGVDAPEGRCGVVGDRPHLRGVGHVGDEIRRLAALLHDRVDEAAQPLLAPRRDDDLRTRGGQAQRGRPPDPARRAHDHRDLLVERFKLKHLEIPCIWRGQLVLGCTMRLRLGAKRHQLGGDEVGRGPIYGKGRTASGGRVENRLTRQEHTIGAGALRAALYGSGAMGV